MELNWEQGWENNLHQSQQSVSAAWNKNKVGKIIYSTLNMVYLEPEIRIWLGK